MSIRSRNSSVFHSLLSPSLSLSLSRNRESRFLFPLSTDKSQWSVGRLRVSFALFLLPPDQLIALPNDRGFLLLSQTQTRTDGKRAAHRLIATKMIRLRVDGARGDLSLADGWKYQGTDFWAASPSGSRKYPHELNTHKLIMLSGYRCAERRTNIVSISNNPVEPDGWDV